VVDVNSGNKSNTESDQETTAFNVNMEACRELARQLRLRDMGGIIVVDFIDMRKPEHKRLIYEKMKEEMKTDRSKFTVLPLTKFGLMQITRQRVRPEMNIATLEKCPTCNGTGQITASILVSDLIENNLEYILQKQNEKSVCITVHPYLHAYFTKGIISTRLKWFFRYGSLVKIEKDSSMGLTEFKFSNKAGETIEVLS
jgi:ribonuclease G